MNSKLDFLKTHLEATSLLRSLSLSVMDLKGAFLLERKQKRHGFQSVALFSICVFYTTAPAAATKIKEKNRFRFRASINAALSVNLWR